MHYIFLGSACCHDSPGAAVRPEIQIMLCIKSYNPASRSSARRVDPHAVAQRCSQKTIGISLPQIILCQERKLVKIVHRFYILGTYALILHTVAHVWDILIYVLYLLNQSLTLPLPYLLIWCSLYLTLEIVFAHLYAPFISGSTLSSSALPLPQRLRLVFTGAPCIGATSCSSFACGSHSQGSTLKGKGPATMPVLLL